MTIQPKALSTHDRDKVIAAAKEAGITYSGTTPEIFDSQDMLAKFYAIAHEDGRQAEREEVVLCDAEPVLYFYPFSGATLHPSRIEESRKETWVPLYRARGDSK